jgi:hypothetical protein
VQCTNGRCDNGQACNGVGNICGEARLPDGGLVRINASQNCCDGMKQVCKLDRSGVPRCFGGGSGNCPNGYTGEPGCCIDIGNVCQFRDQCCNGALCLPGDGGVLRCQGSTCTPLGGTCTTDGDCCGGLCLGGVCRTFTQNPGDGGAVTPDGGGGIIVLPDGGVVLLDGGTLCAPNGASCTFSNDCCSSICTNGVCGTPTVCQPLGGVCTASADCCSGTTCSIPPGSNSGTCAQAACISAGQTCRAGGTSCCSGLSCLTSSLTPCGATGQCTCTVEIN